MFYYHRPLPHPHALLINLNKKKKQYPDMFILDTFFLSIA